LNVIFLGKIRRERGEENGEGRGEREEERRGEKKEGGEGGGGGRREEEGGRREEGGGRRKEGRYTSLTAKIFGSLSRASFGVRMFIPSTKFNWTPYFFAFFAWNGI
jgi:hypothetical protein